MKHRKKLLATGHLGFVGTAMKEFLQGDGEHEASWCLLDKEPDVLDAAALRATVEAFRPDWIVHLAAQSHVPSSWSDPLTTLQVNAGGTANLLKALDDTGFTGRLLYVSSADIYGAVPEEELPLTEHTPPAPRNPYASSKVAGEELCRQWARTRPLDVVIARPFNHTGAGQRPDFALPAFAQTVAAIKRGRQEPKILTGDLDVTRDFLDVRDVVAAYLALLARGRSGETYNVCSGREVHLGDALRMLVELAGVRAQIETDPQRLRPSEQRRMFGDHSRLTEATGWVPRFSLADTLTQLLDYWMQDLDK
ncbi:GDP-mannose 4,6-dehydratase [Ramlibacter sp. WS9]|uniref:GDP-mannose 4,6-dehydratase n=1 Tax=Ramlibacter sp. WS9 TaxID=1882741 RepID=UPI0018EEC14F|nr:GDP-mannose 4,6-dehydratase [Ramlibacter sp. WS9]